MSATTSWFYGNLGRDECTKLLLDQGIGTFCLRFSSSGQLAISFVNKTGLINHVLILQDNGLFRVSGKQTYDASGNNFPFEGNEEIGFRNLHRLVEFYLQRNIFKQPLKKNQTGAIEEEEEKRKREEEKEEAERKKPSPILCEYILFVYFGQTPPPLFFPLPFSCFGKKQKQKQQKHYFLLVWME